jgi:hypothetical protein
LRLRPCWPPWLERVTIHNLHLGDAIISLQYEHTTRESRYLIEQVAGGVPVRLIFEPTFTQQIDSVHVDEVAADLQLQITGTRVLAPVQVMLDHARELRFAHA